MSKTFPDLNLRLKTWRGPSDATVFFANFFAHGGALIGGKLVGAPFDRLRVLLQVNRSSSSSVTDVCRQAYSQGGMWSFYRGIKSHVGSVAIGLPLRLSLYRSAQLLYADKKSSYLHRAACHCASSWATLCVIYPLDVQYTRLAAASHAEPSLFTAVFKDRSVPVSQLYRGFSLCLAASVPYIAVCLAAHDVLRPILTNGATRSTNETRVRTPSEALTQRPPLYPANLLCGIAAGLIAQSVVYPLDTIRRRFMIDSSYTCWTKCLSDSLANRRALYTGLGINALKFIPEAGALCIGYYTVQDILRMP